MKRTAPTTFSVKLLNLYKSLFLSEAHFNKGKAKVIPLQARCGPEGW